MKDYELQSITRLPSVKEFNISVNGHRFRTICGEDTEGWFIAIPDWNICVKSDDPENVYYNTDKLRATGRLEIENVPEFITKAIAEHWEDL